MKKKIYFIRANKTKHGGAEVYLSRLSIELKKQNVVHSVVHSSLSKLLPSWIRFFFFNQKVCKDKKDNDLYFSLERITCPDIYRAGDGVHKVFIKVENKSFFNPLHRVYLYLEKKCFMNAQKIIANSNMIKEQIIETYNIKQEKIKVIYNGINLDVIDTKKAYLQLGKEFPLDASEETKIFSYVGSGFRRKGVEEFLIIFSKLKTKNVKAFIIGKEKKMYKYKRLVKELGVEDKVIFTGAREDVKYFYMISDIFLFPTHYEPFSNVVLEAMNYGNVVITTKQNGAHEILDSEYTMETPNDYSIVNKIDDLLSDRVKLQKVKERNLVIVKEFSIEKNVKETLRIIHEVMH